MKVLLINTVLCSGSTGKICINIAEHMERKGYICKIAYGRTCVVPEQYKKYAVKIGSKFDVYWHGVMTRLFDKHGLGSVSATKKFLKWADKYNPDILWLHNIHGYYINYKLLFAWIKSRPNMQVRWTLHDCWAFTGHCSHFTIVKCEQWKTHCSHCCQTGSYPASYLSNVKDNFATKKSSFTGVKDMTIITPSKWLAGLVKKSFLQEYPVVVYNNKVDTNVFKPTPGNFREKYSLVGKKIILGVANIWGERKGLKDFLELRKILDESYVIVLVGLSSKQIKSLPAGIIGIQRTVDQEELAHIYTTSDVFFNPSREETFGLTTLEASCCGTTPIVYNSTASTEVAQQVDGFVVEEGDVVGVARRIREINEGIS